MVATWLRSLATSLALRCPGRERDFEPMTDKHKIPLSGATLLTALRCLY